MATKRTHNVQTPGAAPAPAAQASGTEPDSTVETVEGPVEQTSDTSSAPQTPEAPEIPAAPVEASPARESKVAQKPTGSAGYRDIPASDIDPHTLTAPVLCRDGWVVPAPKEA